MKLAVIRPGYHELDHQFCHNLAEKGFDVTLLIPIRSLVDVFYDKKKEINYKVYRFSSISPVIDLPFSFGILFNLFKYKYDIIHVGEDFQINSFFAAIYSKIMGKELFVTNERYRKSRYKINHYIYKVIDNTLTKFVHIVAKKIIVHTQRTKNFTLNILNKKFLDKILFLPIGVDFKEIEIKYIVKKKLSLLFVGRLIEVKNIFMILKAIKILDDKYNIELNIIGDGNLKNDIIQYLFDNNLEKKVNILGFIEHKELYRYYLNSDIFLLTSHTEVAGAVILEAMSYGKPCIVTNVGGMTDFVLDGYNGFIVKLDDVDELKNKIIEFYNNRKLIEEYGINSYNLVKIYFDNKLLYFYYKNLFEGLNIDDRYGKFLELNTKYNENITNLGYN